MKKILIQYLYIFVITLAILLIFTWVNACEVEEIKVDEKYLYVKNYKNLLKKTLVKNQKI